MPNVYFGTEEFAARARCGRHYLQDADVRPLADGFFGGRAAVLPEVNPIAGVNFSGGHDDENTLIVYGQRDGQEVSVTIDLQGQDTSKWLLRGPA